MDINLAADKKIFLTDKLIKNFFYPSSLCVIGASTKPESIGYELLKSIRDYGYKGELFAVNPKANEILGIKCFRDVNDLPSKIDLAVVVVPKTVVEETIEKILNKGIKSIVLITAGFKEVGKEGAEAENRILEKIRSNGARLVGPNCMGVITTFDDVKLNATFVAEKPEKGRTAFFSQSGGICAAVLNSLRDTDIRFGHFISAGNKADISENDLLEFWQSDEKISTLTFYLESFVNGEKFIKYFFDKKINKPVIILKGGRGKAAIKAAQSHTGAIGSSDKVVEAVLDQFGVIRTDTLSELFNTSKGFEHFAIPKGNKIAIVTNAGGPGILTVDSLEEVKLELATLSEETKKKIKEIIHPEGSANNPIDLLPGGTAEQFKQVSQILLKDKDVDAIISVFVEPVMVPAFDIVENINSIKSTKPIYQVVMPLPEFWENYRNNSKYKIPLFRNPEEPAKVISNILFYSSKRKRDSKYLKSKRNRIPTESRQLKPGSVSNEEIVRITGEYNLPLIISKSVEARSGSDGLVNESESNGNFSAIKYPLVVKGISKSVIHKSELNAVKIDIKNHQELLEAKKSIEQSFKSNNVQLESFLIQPFIRTKHELLIGGFRDPTFSPMIMFGLGGKYVEAFNDTCMKSAYLCDADVEEMIDRTQIGKILRGVRNEKPVDLKRLKEIILSAAQMMLDNPGIVEFDFNPLIIGEDNSFNIVDARMSHR